MSLEVECPTNSLMTIETFAHIHFNMIWTNIFVFLFKCSCYRSLITIFVVIWVKCLTLTFLKSMCKNTRAVCKYCSRIFNRIDIDEAWWGYANVATSDTLIWWSILSYVNMSSVGWHKRAHLRSPVASFRNVAMKRVMREPFGFIDHCHFLTCVANERTLNDIKLLC